jgi:MAC/Perforin domain
MIGGKASFRQYSSRSDVTNTSEWQVAVQAKYGAVTASASVDQTSSSHISKFQMSNTVQTLGGSNSLIASPADFGAWLQSLNGHPAIIEMTAVVPLWQLLGPGARRDALKEAILSYARRFQAGALFGSLEQHNNNSSSDTWVEGTARGKEIGRRVSVGYAESYSEAYTRGNACLWLWLSTGMEKTDLPGLAVYGGRQMQSNYDSSQPLKEISSWGSRTSKGKQLQEIDYFQAYTHSSAGYGDRRFSHISLFVGPIEEAHDDAWVVVGGHTLYSRGRKGADWGRSVGNTVEQDIATAVIWNEGWELGHIFLHLQKVANQLPEIPE